MVSSRFSEATGGSNMRQQTGSASALARLGDQRATEPLASVLEDAEADVRFEAAFGLAMLGDSRAVEPLISALGDPSQSVVLAAHALGELGDRRAVENLRAASTDERTDQNARLAAAEALGKLGEDAERAKLAALHAGDPFRLLDEEERQPLEPAFRRPDGGGKAIRGGLGEPYCSERCYELGGGTITRELLSGWRGDCSVCRKPIKLSVGGRASMVCYRPGEFLYFCGDSSCADAVKQAVRGDSCVVCGAYVG
jgi:HEAT repeat protein